MNLGGAGENGGRSQSDDHDPEHLQDIENGDSLPGISFAFDAEIYKGTGNSTSSNKPFQVLKINGRLVVKVSISQFAISAKHRLTTNGDDSWSI